MRFALLAYEGGGQRSAEERAAELVDRLALEAELAAAGVLVAAEVLAGVEAAATVRVRGDATVKFGVGSGPDLDLSGIMVVEAADLDDAVKLARRSPAARAGCVEVRPVR